MGQLFRYAKWGFLPAVLTVSCIFGLGHLSQGSDMISSAMAALVTGLGGILFGWIYIETNYNLWYSVFLHVLMNFSWTAFTLSGNGAVGTLGSNLVRMLTVVLSIGLVVLYKRNKKLPYILNLRTLWSNNRDSPESFAA